MIKAKPDGCEVEAENGHHSFKKFGYEGEEKDRTLAEEEGWRRVILSRGELENV